MYKFNIKDIDKEEFIITDHYIAGQLCHFVRPQANYFKWREDTLNYRSAIFRFNGEPISLSFPKFFNLEEAPHIAPFDGDLSKASLINKEDGSTLIVSKYRGELILRTRGTVDASGMPNAGELEYFKKDILPKLPADETWDKTYLFEWVSPDAVIIVKYPKYNFILTNIVNHEDYSLTTQSKLDEIAVQLGVSRPERFTYYSISHLIKDIDKWQDKEGICLYYNNDQHIRKIKSVVYLKRHAFKSNCTVKSVVELYIEWGRLFEDAFREKLMEEFDYECYTYAEPTIKQLFEAVGNLSIEVLIVEADTKLYSDLNQKDFALKMMELYKNKLYSKSLSFAIRAGKETQDIKDKYLKYLLGL